MPRIPDQIRDKAGAEIVSSKQVDPDHKHAGYVSQWFEGMNWRHRTAIFEETGWSRGMKDNDGDFVPSPILTPKKTRWLVELGRPVSGNGQPVAPWVAWVEIDESRAQKSDIRAAENAVKALEAVSIGALSEEAIGNASCLAERLLEISIHGGSKTSVAAARAYVKLMDTLIGLDPDRATASGAPMIAVQINTKGDAEVKIEKIRRAHRRTKPLPTCQACGAQLEKQGGACDHCAAEGEEDDADDGNYEFSG